MPIINLVYEAPELPFTPGANTIAYYKFDGNLNDSSGNNYNPTNSSNVSVTTLDGLKCAYFNGGYITYPDIHNVLNSSFTISVYIKSEHMFIASEGQAGTNRLYTLQRVLDGQPLLRSGFYANDLNYYKSFSQAREYVTFTIDGDSHYGTIYINGQQVATKTFSAPNVQSGPLYIGTNAEVPGNSSWVSTGYMSEFIIEDKARTAQEVADYYNQTKANYGIS